jgi:hypothetical protein
VEHPEEEEVAETMIMRKMRKGMVRKEIRVEAGS